MSDPDRECSWVKALPSAADQARVLDAKVWIMTVVPHIIGGLDWRYSIHGAEHGKAYEQIVQAADEMGVDLIVMAAHRPSLKDHLIGPNTARVVRHAKSSVQFARE